MGVGTFFARIGEKIGIKAVTATAEKAAVGVAERATVGTADAAASKIADAAAKVAEASGKVADAAGKVGGKSAWQTTKTVAKTAAVTTGIVGIPAVIGGHKLAEHQEYVKDHPQGGDTFGDMGKKIQNHFANEGEAFGTGSIIGAALLGLIGIFSGSGIAAIVLAALGLVGGQFAVKSFMHDDKTPESPAAPAGAATPQKTEQPVVVAPSTPTLPPKDRAPGSQPQAR